MKVCCEKIFCFWKKLYRKQENSLVSIESTKMLNHEKEQDNYSNIQSSQQIENTKFKQKDITIELSTALTIEEDTTFPEKYLNEIEKKPSFHFRFSKANIVDFIEEQINDKEKYSNLVNKNGFDIYINQSGSVFNQNIPIIKMFYTISKSSFTRKDVTVKMIDDYMNIPEKRLKFDTSLKDYKILERINNEVYLLHYVCKSPMILVSERDVVDKRFDFYHNDIYYDFSSSVKDDLIPKEQTTTRMTDYFSVCKIYEDKDNFFIISITQIDSKFNMPPTLLSVQLPIRYKTWYDSLIKEINEGN